MITTLPSRYEVYRFAMGLFDEELVSEHSDPAEAIRACGEEMFIAAADEHAQKWLDAEKTHQIKLLADQAEVTQRVESHRKLKVESAAALDTGDAGQTLVVGAASVATDDAEQTLVAESAGRYTDDPEALLATFRREFYGELVLRDLRVGQPISVEHSGNEEEISHCGGRYSGRRGDVDIDQVTVRRVNGLPEPVSKPAAAIFRQLGIPLTQPTTTCRFRVWRTIQPRISKGTYTSADWPVSRHFRVP